MSRKASTAQQPPDEPAEKHAPADPGPLPDSGPSDPTPTNPLDGYFNIDASASDSDIQHVVNHHIRSVAQKHGCFEDYDILFLYDALAIGRSDADRIYTAISRSDRSRPVLLVITSPGGDVASAYLIAKLCREYTSGSFELAVPRQAKSAATLIACGADHIHMGSLSELGPIDPQFGHIPALALKNSVEHLATLAEAYPAAAEMFAGYLARSLRVEALGYYERVAESAVQYAIRLLGKRQTGGGRSAERIAHTLVYEYKDHGFVIDAHEANEIFGPEVVQLNTPEYQLGNDVYNALTLAEWLVDWRFAKTLAFTGGLDEGCAFLRRRQE